MILVGVSRSGKTPTSLYLAMQFGIKAANYPLIPEDFERNKPAGRTARHRGKLFGLTIGPDRLSQIRQERLSQQPLRLHRNCLHEIEAAQRMMKREGISGSTPPPSPSKKSPPSSCRKSASTPRRTEETGRHARRPALGSTPSSTDNKRAPMKRNRLGRRGGLPRDAEQLLWLANGLADSAAVPKTTSGTSASPTPWTACCAPRTKTPSTPPSTTLSTASAHAYDELADMIESRAEGASSPTTPRRAAHRRRR